MSSEQYSLMSSRYRIQKEGRGRGEGGAAVLESLYSVCKSVWVENVLTKEHHPHSNSPSAISFSTEKKSMVERHHTGGKYEQMKESFAINKQCGNGTLFS